MADNGITKLEKRIDELNSKCTQVLTFLSFTIAAGALIWVEGHNDVMRRPLQLLVAAIFPTLIGILPVKEVYEDNANWYRIVRWSKVIVLWAAVGFVFWGAVDFARAIARISVSSAAGPFPSPNRASAVVCSRIQAHMWWTYLFYAFVVVLVVAAAWFVWQYWHKARGKEDLRWIDIDSRNMYVDGAKTMITASGIAVALLASSTVASARTANDIVALSAKFAVVCLIACVCFSFIAIMALLRTYELAHSRWVVAEVAAGRTENARIQQGALTNRELLWILVPAGVAISCFLVGFLFLGRIAFHF